MALPHASVEDEESASDGIIWLTDEEARAHFDKSARDLLGMSSCVAWTPANGKR